MGRHVRKGDMVVVTAGKDRGRQGKVMRVLPKNDRVIVQGMNVHSKRVKPSQQNPQGGVIQKELSIHISNVSPVSDGKPTRVRFEWKDDGSRARVSSRTGEAIGPELRKARP